jgi:hypothetical protein
MRSYGWQWSRIALVTVVLVVASLATVDEARAQNRSFKGSSWVFTLHMPAGAMPLQISFKAGGKATLTTPAGPVAGVYREDGASYSIAAEVPGDASMTGSAFTLTLRGKRSWDSGASGTLMIVTRNRDSSPAGVQIITGDAYGQKQ